ncbi:hypothetical protein MBLNU230_g6866t3 [Neophaeotheca triangularis]
MLGKMTNGVPKRISNDFDVQEILSQLTTTEKISLVSGTDFWHLAAVERLGIPAVRTTDGPNGARGTRFFEGVPAACFPCGTALGATWDQDLLKKSGDSMAQEAIAKGAAVLLGPTVNMQRGPLGGRGFESFSEDPVLAGNLAAAEISGIQSRGVSAAIKHFVCNDLEDKRMASNSIVTTRAMREIYLKPFQIAQRDAKPWSYMTAYNLINGLHCSENEWLLQKVLREEWEFDGLVMSDWFGTYSTTESIRAGLDLEMPGPTYIRGKLIGQALTCGKLLMHHLDARVYQVLKLIKKSLPLDIPSDAEEKTIDTPETAAMLRSVASASIVLMKNDKNILPLSKEKTTAVIGPNAEFAAFSGGGSASLRPYYAVSPLEGVRNKAKNCQYTLGAPGWKRPPLITEMSKTKKGEKGLNMTIYLEPHSNKDKKAVYSKPIESSYVPLSDFKHPDVPDELFWGDLDGQITPEESSEYEFSCSVAGTAKIFVNGELVVDNMTKQTPGDSFFGSGTIEEIGVVELEAGKTYDVHVEFGTLPTKTYEGVGATAFGAGGIRVGCYRKLDVQSEQEKAVALAKKVDQVVLCIGLNSDWESEGYDRGHMDLPPGSDDLVTAVLAANPNTVIVNQSGTPVTMPWASQTTTLLQAWYGGNETGNAIADVVFGDVNPSGKLPLTFPIRNEDNPSYLTYSSDDNRTLYGEDVYMGYRWYDKTKKAVLFPFGHGLSYTTFALSNLAIRTHGDEITVTVDVANTGNRDGAEVVQVYFSPLAPSITRPVKELKGFAKVDVKAGQTGKAEVKLSKKYATSFWHEGRDAWVCEQGSYGVAVGATSAELPLSGEIEVDEQLVWKGL